MKKILLINFLSIFILAACSASSTSIAPVVSDQNPEQAESIMYSSVAEALSGLKAREDVSIEESQGWTTITEADGLIIWAFAPANHPAYPALSRRVIFEDQEGWHIQMNILCEAEKTACDQFTNDFEVLNEQMQQFIEQQHSP
jgi:rubrerythrin